MLLRQFKYQLFAPGCNPIVIPGVADEDDIPRTLTWKAPPRPLFSGQFEDRRVARGAHPQDHSLRSIRAMVDDILGEISPDFTRLYAKTGRPPIPPGTAAAGAASADLLYDPQRAPALGTAWSLPPALPR